MTLQGKKLLILGGASVHFKLVNAAREMGVYTIVTDNVPLSYSKSMANKSYDINIYDLDALIEMCKKENVDGVLSCYLDPCQRPYNELCERLGYPCYGTKGQFFTMTNKHAFKKACRQNDVDTIPEYLETEFDSITYPVFVKPVDSRGSRGQSVCYTKEDLDAAISIAKKESSNGEIVVEKYMKGASEFQVTYFFINGVPYLLRTVDSYCGSESNRLNKVVACAVSPSQYTDLYIQTAHKRVIKMFENLHIRNGPVFMQGFVDKGVFRFFDPGLRFPGVDYDLIYKRVFNIDVMKAMITFALSGSFGASSFPERSVYLEGQRAAVLFPTVRAGLVENIEGEDILAKTPEVISILPRWGLGSMIPWSYNVNQRSAEIDILCSNTEALKSSIDRIQSKYKFYDHNGSDMTLELFDTSRIV